MTKNYLKIELFFSVAMSRFSFLKEKQCLGPLIKYINNYVLRNKVIKLILILILTLILGCTQVNLPQVEGKTWVSKQPTQCAEEWQGYVSERNLSRDEGIKEFYQVNYDITINNITWIEARGGPCEACNCLAATKLFIQVNNNDITTLRDLGYN
jgi:hypothetical protein